MPDTIKSSGREEKLASELEDYRRQILAVSQDARDLIEGLSEAQLNWQPSAEQWSIAECLDHLAVTNREMIKKLRAAVIEARAKGLLGYGPFRHGWLGNMFVRSIEPPVKRKFKAPQIFRPRAALSLDEVARDFFSTQEEVLSLINEANGVHLARVKIASPISKWIKYSLGQAFRLIATHERRHLWQARQVRNNGSFPAEAKTTPTA